ncbi:MAG TPA: NAD(P)H-hydrate dehydratase [Bacteroidales bacterium]|nr:NAD(P)H-hydrate dehydratase [Bacteroidales bacterium]
MKIFSCNQIRDIDSYTIENEPIKSIDLMERAAGKILSWISEEFNRSDRFIIFSGPGNNGGDGLALARMMTSQGYDVEVYHLKFASRNSVDCEVNLKRFKESQPARLKYIEKIDQFPLLSSEDIIIDAIFGSGLSRPVEGLVREIIQQINLSDAIKISIDVPSGLFCENNNNNVPDGIIHADFTLSFQFPKLAFLFAENSDYTGIWKVLPIGLHEKAISAFHTHYNLLTNSDVVLLLKNRTRFEHKGNFGHGLLISGSYGKMGAAVLGAKAALRTGIGLLTCHIPSCGYSVLQSSVPEAMVQTDPENDFVSSAGDTSKFTAIGIGPGLGTGQATQNALRDLLEENKKPVVIDADALNIISLNKNLLKHLTQGTILTPHPKEFERLAGKTGNSFERLQRQVEFSSEYKCIVILKGAYTSVTFPDGTVYFNNTGNPGMATGGSGDVLTGMLLSLLSQGYSPQDASVLGVWLHGLAGDIAASESSFESMIASDIINCIGRAFNKIRGF